jgi:hypothetical protein
MPRRSSPDRSREAAVGSEETIMLDSNLPSVPRRDPWNKGRLIGQKRPLKPKDVWSIRVRLQVERRARNLALSNLAIDSKLRGCDLVRLVRAEIEELHAKLARMPAVIARAALGIIFSTAAITTLFNGGLSRTDPPRAAPLRAAAPTRFRICSSS